MSSKSKRFAYGFTTIVVVLSLIFIGAFITPIKDVFSDTVSAEEAEQFQTVLYINNTTFIDYPFIEGWNSITSDNYIIINRFISQYRWSFYNHLTLSVDLGVYTGLHSLSNIIDYSLTIGEITQQQYDCAQLQLYILSHYVYYI